MKKLKVELDPSAVPHRAKSHRAALGEAVLRVAHFDSAPVARPYQADETQQVGESPGHIGGIVSTGKVPSTNS